MTVLRSILLFAGLTVVMLNEARALDSTRHISQYAHTAWRLKEGYFSGELSAMAQTPDGYLWIGMTTGLVRFDGVRFTPWLPPEGGETLPTTTVISLYASHNGTLWIGTEGGLARLSGGKLFNYTHAVGRINAITEDSSGGIWIVRSRIPEKDGVLCQVLNNRMQCYGKASGLETPGADSVAADSAGNLWVGGARMIARLQRQAVTIYPAPATKQAAGVAAVEGIVPGPDGSLWVGFSTPGLGLQSFTEARGWKPVHLPGLDGPSLHVTALFKDREGALWIGTLTDGIYRIHGSSVDHFGTAAGLSGNAISGFQQDKEGSVWASTAGGVDKFCDLPVTSYTEVEGLTSDTVHSVFAGRSGTVWIGIEGGLNYLRNGIVSSIRSPHAFPGDFTTALLEDRSGQLWLGIDHGLFTFKDGKFRPILEEHRKQTGIVNALAQDVDGSIWVAEPGAAARILNIRGRNIVKIFNGPQVLPGFGLIADPKGGVWVNIGDRVAHVTDDSLNFPPALQNTEAGPLRDLALDAGGALWAVGRDGVLRWDGSTPQVLTEKNGLPCTSRGSANFDLKENLWLSLKCGIVRLDSESLRRWIRNPKSQISFERFDVSDGMRKGATPFLPSVSLGEAGRLWFATGSELQMVDTADLHRNPLPPPVYVTGLIADHKSVEISNKLRLPALTRDIEIDYTALSFVAPQRVRFRYRLEGHDTEWQDVGPRRAAYYSSLAPHSYSFRVIACNNSGVWNDQGATVQFTIVPAWYQTNAARVLCLLLACSIGYGLYLIKTRQYAAELRLRFDERLEERSRLARDLHDTLLQTIQCSRLLAEHVHESVREPTVKDALQRILEWLERATVEGRAALDSLRSSIVESDDLATAFRRALVNCSAGTGIVVSVTATGSNRGMHPIVRDEIYRIGEEAIRNACCHSGGSRIDLELVYGQTMLLRIRDDGKGIEPDTVRLGKAGHYGLTGMRERAARIGAKLIFSASQPGTLVVLTVPGAAIYDFPQSLWPRFMSLWQRFQILKDGRD